MLRLAPLALLLASASLAQAPPQGAEAARSAEDSAEARVDALATALLAVKAGTSPQGALTERLAACAAGSHAARRATLDALAADLGRVLAGSSLQAGETRDLACGLRLVVASAGNPSPEAAEAIESVHGLLSGAGADPGEAAMLKATLHSLLMTAELPAYEGPPEPGKARASGPSGPSGASEASTGSRKDRKRKKKALGSG